MPQLTELKCPNCGAKLERVGDADQAMCPHCGAELLIERKAVAIAPAADARACPQCGDRAKKVAFYHRQGLSKGSYRGDVWREDGFDPVSLSGYSQTELSRLLSPPDKPKKGWTGPLLYVLGAVSFAGGILAGWVVWLFSGIVVGLLAMMVGVDPSEPSAAALLPCGFGLIPAGAAFAIGFGFFRTGSRTESRARERLAVEMPRWDEAIRRWRSSYYCETDDIVFIPEEQQRGLAPSERFHEFLYAD